MLAPQQNEIIRKLNLRGRKNFMVFMFDPAGYPSSSIFLLNYLTERLKLKGIYVNISKDYDDVIRGFKSTGIDSGDLYLIMGKDGHNHDENLHNMEKQGSLVELSLSMTEKLNTGRYNFVFFDWFSDFLTFNGPIAISRFVKYCIDHFKNYDAIGIIASPDNESSSYLNPYVINELLDELVIA